MNQIIPYNKNLKENANKLRQSMTLSEVLLWKKLREKYLGYDFDRQKPINNYIVDLICKELKLAIEIDGNSHDNQDSFKKDTFRQEYLEKSKIKFLRFTDLSLKKDMSQVLYVVQNWIEQNKKEPTPTPPKDGI